MQRAIELAKSGAGYVSPNPLVGAVVVKNNQIIAEGYHKAYGQEHAERDAINKCSASDLAGATLYVTLEPCSHFGKQPPCTDLIIHSGIKKVVIANSDPNPNVSGKGTDVLRQTGIEVIQGILENEAKFMNRFFFKHIVKRIPYIMLKAAQTLDGYIATTVGESKWISCEESRRRVHRLRHEFDAIMVGFGTAINDNPKLNVRDFAGRNPKRIILDSNMRLPEHWNVLADEIRENTILCISKEFEKTSKAMQIAHNGVNILALPYSEVGFDLRTLFNKIYTDYNIGSVMVEGGAKVFSSLLKKDLVDEIQLFIAPKIFGNGIKTFSEFEISNIHDSKKFKISSNEISGDDIHIILTK